MAASGSIMAANAMVDALRRGDEDSAVGLIDRVIGAAHLGNCLLIACETGHPKCTEQDRCALDSRETGRQFSVGGPPLTET